MQTNQGINVSILGDYGPFSRIGKSIGYQVTVGKSSFLVDCGSPVFQKIGGHGLKHIKGLIITHCHDDHKRWFTDFSLFSRYAPDMSRKISLYTSDEVNQGLLESSEAALGSSLSSDSSRIIDIAYDDYVDFHPIAPRPKYRIVNRDLGEGRFQYQVVDREGWAVSPERAKIFISPKRRTPRLLFRDPESGEWVEPIAYYPFSSTVFYEQIAPYRDPEGFTVEAINAPVWHGIPSIGIRFTTAQETLVFSSDTNQNVELWEKLYREKHDCSGRHESPAFRDAAVIHGDINDYIERTWSAARYHDAVASFRDAFVIHDIALRKSVVHTDYRDLDKTVLDPCRTVLTHGPDKITSSWILCEAEKNYRIAGTTLAEVVGTEEYPFCADFYHKEGGRYFVCFRNDSSPHAVFERDGILFLSTDPYRGNARLICHVEIYEDIRGEYFPKLDDDTTFYNLRPDGRVERITMGDTTSRGEIASNQRPRLTKQYGSAAREAVPASLATN
jgi:ribonuclease BN (tRNA processing enzyme)